MPLASLTPDIYFLHTVIDTEGFEPFVIAGMGLQHQKNRLRFSMFQFEIGGTWAVNDDSHLKGAMGLGETFTFLQNRGYLLYIIGRHGVYPVTPGFYDKVPKLNEGYGEFIAGNVLAVYEEGVDEGVRCFIKNLIIK
jgi:hypothetical protein